jgi:cytochrome c
MAGRARQWLPYAAAIAAMTAILAAGLSLIHPWGNLRENSSTAAAVLAGEAVPVQVRTLLVQKCGDCHSNNTRWPLYSRVAPTSWLVEHDVALGRRNLNFSTWEQYGIDARIDLLSKVGSQLRQEKMPLRGYLMLHSEARLSAAERELILNWSKTERRRLLLLLRCADL